MSANSEVNKANAQHSTGPKSEAGKQRSALNALRHGLTSQIVVMPSEDLAAYQLHVANFNKEHRPKGALEANLVQTIADINWRQHRVAAMETNLFTLASQGRTPASADTPPEIQDALAQATAVEKYHRAISNLSLHSARLSRQLDLTIKQLRELQKARLAEEERELTKLARIIEMHESEGESFDPTSLGFVFTEKEINAHRQARTRDRLAREAFHYLGAAA